MLGLILSKFEIDELNSTDEWPHGGLPRLYPP